MVDVGGGGEKSKGLGRASTQGVTIVWSVQAHTLLDGMVICGGVRYDFRLWKSSPCNLEAAEILFM